MKRIEEIYWLRFYGCLAVFSFHFFDRLNQYVDSVYIDLARIPTVLGTPIFIFISIFLFSSRYGDRPPSGFLIKRLKYVMLPYVVYGLAYALTKYLNLRREGVPVDLVDILVEYLIYAGWHGYFLIIAMQFYAFYWVYSRHGLERWLPPVPWLALGSLISIAYWALIRFFDFEPPGYLHWIAPLGWIYLFFLAMLVVRHYPQLVPQRMHEIPWIARLSRPELLLAYVGIIALFTWFGWLEHSSKEAWVVPLFILFTLYTVTRLRNVRATPLVKFINRYSFGIYLAHPMFFAMVDFAHEFVPFSLFVYSLLLIVVGMVGSIALNRVANGIPGGGMLFGKTLYVSEKRHTTATQAR
ncbi:acyltransferase [Billgrantia diversa]|uniref:acyltransferase family protein n=1 Tax=Halomonas sp. MCCC 1A13316 TaxID=2733487 RepID=UPI0018A62870|nr:acyltransferase [Halomonas sp. MCCC 1A13316]QOR40054.1 acyltransferase [Halomonas sp. MCCC 1A13316]